MQRNGAIVLRTVEHVAYDDIFIRVVDEVGACKRLWTDILYRDIFALCGNGNGDAARQFGTGERVVVYALNACGQHDGGQIVIAERVRGDIFVTLAGEVCRIVFVDTASVPDENAAEHNVRISVGIGVHPRRAVERVFPDRSQHREHVGAVHSFEAAATVERVRAYLGEIDRSREVDRGDGRHTSERSGSYLRHGPTVECRGDIKDFRRRIVGGYGIGVVGFENEIVRRFVIFVVGSAARKSPDDVYGGVRGHGVFGQECLLVRCAEVHTADFVHRTLGDELFEVRKRYGNGFAAVRQREGDVIVGKRSAVGYAAHGKLVHVAVFVIGHDRLSKHFAVDGRRETVGKSAHDRTAREVESHKRGTQTPYRIKSDFPSLVRLGGEAGVEIPKVGAVGSQRPSEQTVVHALIGLSKGLRNLAGRHYVYRRRRGGSFSAGPGYIARRVEVKGYGHIGRSVNSREGKPFRDGYGAVRVENLSVAVGEMRKRISVGRDDSVSGNEFRPSELRSDVHRHRPQSARFVVRGGAVGQPALAEVKRHGSPFRCGALQMHLERARQRLSFVLVTDFYPVRTGGRKFCKVLR